MNDYIFQLTEMGRERASSLWPLSVPISAQPRWQLSDYIASVQAQSLTRKVPTREALEAAFADLVMNKKLLDRLGPAVCSGRGLFLFGAPGNGKTSIAERVTRAFGRTIWIPRAITVDGRLSASSIRSITRKCPSKRHPVCMTGEASTADGFESAGQLSW